MRMNGRHNVNHSHHLKKDKQTGFTLVEILVALVLLALSMGTVISSIGNNAFQIEFQRNHFHANRVAMHVAGEYYVLNSWPKLGTKKGDIKVGGSTWEWEAKVLNTPEKKMRRVEIRIFNDISPDQSLAKHVLFVTNPQFK